MLQSLEWHLLINKMKRKKLEYNKVKLETILFGKCIQCFHLGDYNNMNDTLNKMCSYEVKIKKRTR